MVCGESAERYDDAWPRMSFGCLPALGGMPDASGDADYYGKSSKRERLLKKNS